MRRRLLCLSAALIAGLVAAPLASVHSADFPGGKPITLIVPYSAGGTSDTGARFLADSMERQLGVPVQVVNKPGAASQVGMTELINATPDGHTLALGVLPTLMTHYLDSERQAPYTRASFQPVAHIFQVPNVIAVLASSPYNSLGDLVEAARAAPARVKISDSGLMGAPHLMVMLVQRAGGARFASVHFQGGAPATTALLGEHVDALANAVSDVLPYVKSGQFRVLGVADSEPSALLPDVLTMASQGFDVMAVSASGILAPAGTPEEVVDILATTIENALADEEVKGKLEQLGVAPGYLDPEAFTALWVEYEAKIAPAIEMAKPE